MLAHAAQECRCSNAASLPTRWLVSSISRPKAASPGSSDEARTREASVAYFRSTTMDGVAVPGSEFEQRGVDVIGIFDGQAPVRMKSGSPIHFPRSNVRHVRTPHHPASSFYDDDVVFMVAPLPGMIGRPHSAFSCTSGGPAEPWISKASRCMPRAFDSISPLRRAGCIPSARSNTTGVAAGSNLTR
jgi:hypothetical protein